MQIDLAEIMDSIAEIDGHITIRDLKADQIEALRDKVVWVYNDRKVVNAIVRFGEASFRPEGATEGSVIIKTGSPQYDYEIRAAMLLLFHSGRKEGDQPLKWSSVKAKVSIMSQFAKYCIQRGQKSFRDINTLPYLKLRDLIDGFLHDHKSRGGLNARKYTSNYGLASGLLRTLVEFGLIDRHDFMGLVEELTMNAINKHHTESVLRHSIIPNGVMKQIIAESVAYVDRAQQKFVEFEKIFRSSHKTIKASQAKNPQCIFSNNEKILAPQLGRLLNEYFCDLPRHVYSLDVAFTGQRDDEAQSLKTDCAGSRIENGEPVIFVRSILKKTANNEISLDWVANEITYQAIQLLSKINHLYYERAEIFLEHHRDRLTPEEINNMEHGLKDRWLFGVKLRINSSFFYTGKRGRAAEFLKKYRMPLTDTDIAQLNQMESNYQSVSAHSGKRGKPYAVGDYFHITPHQFRHTFAWFIIANRLGDLDDIKYQFKHLTDAYTRIYTQRGFETIDELIGSIEFYEEFGRRTAIGDIVQSAASGLIAGGGGEHLVRLLRDLNREEEGVIYSDDHQLHFKSVNELVAYATQHSDSIRGLGHGYCTKGPHCKIRNAADPSHCLYCDTYYATPKHLPYWLAIKAGCERGLQRIAASPQDVQEGLQSLKQSMVDNLYAADKVISRLVPPTVIGEVI